MQPNLRLLRARADAICPPPPRSKRQQQTYERILSITPVLLTEFGIDTLTFPNLARALRISTAALRHLFIDFDDLLGVIILTLTHLETLLAATLAIPANAPDAPGSRRAAYRAAASAWLPQHRTMRRLRHSLPPDLAEQATALRQRLAEALSVTPSRPARACAETRSRIAQAAPWRPVPQRPAGFDLVQASMAGETSLSGFARPP